MGYIPDEDLALVALTTAFAGISKNPVFEERMVSRDDTLESLGLGTLDYIDWDIIIMDLERTFGDQNFDLTKLKSYDKVGDIVDYVLTCLPTKKSSRKTSKSDTKKKRATVDLNAYFNAEHYLDNILQEIKTKSELRFHALLTGEDSRKWELPLTLSDNLQGSIQFVLDEEGIEISVVLPRVFDEILEFVIARIIGTEQKSCVYLENDGSAYFVLEGEGPYQMQFSLDVDAPDYYGLLENE